jgi:hypothetical protein
MAQIDIKQIHGASQGSVLFLGTNSVVSENYNSLRWDQTNNILNIAGSIKIDDGSQQNGYVLTTDGNGLATWSPPSINTISKQLISGGAVWSGVGLTFSVSVLQYTFDGPILSAGPTSISLSNGDPTYSRFDAIVVNEFGSISVLQGQATPDPITPSIPDDQLLIQYISISDNATVPTSGVTSSEYIYRDNEYWTGGTFSTLFATSSVNFQYTSVVPFQGTFSTRMILNPTTFVRWTRNTNILLKDYTYLIFRVYFPFTVPNNKTMRLIWRNGTTNVGSYALPFTNGGVSRTITGSWQLCVLPLNYFGTAINQLTSTGNPNNVNNILIGFSGGVQNSYVEALLDEVYLVGGYSTPVPSPNISVQSNGVLVGSRSIINFISGTGSNIVVSDSSLNSRIDVLITASVSGTSGSGTSGSSGVAGTSGTSGDSGTSGTSGDSGTSGTSGDSGTSGTSGTSGDAGTSGTSGTSGTTGTSGTSGTGFTTVSNAGDNRILTSTGSSNSATAETLLTFDSSGVTWGLLSVTGSAYIGGGPTTSPVLSVVGASANSTVFSVQGTFGELFSVNDNLNGSLFSVNDISGLPVIEAFSDNTILMGDYSAPALYTSKKSTVSTSTASIYSFATASYTSAHVDYNIQNDVNLRAGSLVAVWQGSSIQFTEHSTMDIGTTSGFTFSFVISGTYAVLQARASTSSWTVKTILRSI